MRACTHTSHWNCYITHYYCYTHSLTAPPPPTTPPTHLSVTRVVALNGECCPLLPLTLGSDHALLALQAQQTHNTIPPRATEARGAHLTTDTWTGHTVSTMAGRTGGTRPHPSHQSIVHGESMGLPSHTSIEEGTPWGVKVWWEGVVGVALTVYFLKAVWMVLAALMSSCCSRSATRSRNGGRREGGKREEGGGREEGGRGIYWHLALTYTNHYASHMAQIYCPHHARMQAQRAKYVCTYTPHHTTPHHTTPHHTTTTGRADQRGPCWRSRAPRCFWTR